MDVVGIDIGFGFTKATNGRASIIFKSIFGEASEIQFREQLMEGSAGEEHLHLELEDKSYFVGELAERQSNVRSFTLDQNQFIAGFAKTMALAALTKLSASGEPIKIVTGLPISYYRRHREELSKILLGKHPVVSVDNIGKKHEMVVNVNQVRVIPQPFGSLFNLMLSNMAEVADKRFVTEKIGVIDVGFRTSDYSIADKTRYSERGSRTTDSGIAQAYSLIATALREQTGVNIELYRLYGAVAKGVIKIRGKEINLEPLIEDAFSKLASAIASEVERLWIDDWDIDLMVITGGGGAVLTRFLQPLLNGEVMPIDPAQDARLNNVKGYWKYGMNIWGREAKAAPKP